MIAEIQNYRRKEAKNKKIYMRDKGRMRDKGKMREKRVHMNEDSVRRLQSSGVTNSESKDQLKYHDKTLVDSVGDMRIQDSVNKQER